MAVNTKHPPQHYSGLVAPARAWMSAELFRKHKKIICITKDTASAETLSEELKTFLGSNLVFDFPAWDSLPLEQISPSLDISAQRLSVLIALSRSTAGVVVAPVQAIMQKVLSLDDLTNLILELRLNASCQIEYLKQRLQACGYQENSLVETQGEFSAKGQVVDFFPALTASPIRIEIQSGKIVRISEFDPETQRSKDRQLEMVEIIPAKERLPRDSKYCNRKKLSEAIERLKERGKKIESPLREIARFMSAVRNGTLLPGIELIEAICSEGLSSFFSFLSHETHIVIDDKVSLETSADRFWDTLLSREHKMLSEHFIIPELEKLYNSPERIFKTLEGFPCHILDHLELEEDSDTIFSKPALKAAAPSIVRLQTKFNTLVRTAIKSKAESGQAFNALKTFIDEARRKNFNLALVVGTEHRAIKLKQILLSVDIDANIFEGSLIDWKYGARRYPVVICLGHLFSGFELSEEHLIFVAETEIFGERSQRTAKKARTTLKKIMSSLSQLQPGDFLVHRDFGIGCYRGLKHLEVSGSEADFLHIEYADSTLYLPIHNIAKVSKFQAPEGQAPKLDRLKNSRWVDRKAKVRHAVESLAGDLLRLYAARSVLKGWRFDDIGAEDERFAESFPYDETPDQRKAIEDTLLDMASNRPMDRLVCGDVGFGKTEVALRAAFKCLQHGRQVAVLAPTTILAEQHRLTFDARLQGEPVKVGAVSRFCSAQQNKETLQQLSAGKIDLIVGTHRLLSKDVQFQDLGLIIIDEEHRFGVKHKERLKEIKKQVDVLTLTATPIPRTLHMSLLGLRDISVITTPPVDRRIVRTYITRSDETLIKDAIERELGRGGQVFFIHNRVQSIEQITAKLRALVPQARFAFGHGQMHEHTLEKIMQSFLNHEVDVLVSTTIVESGIDVPNANTIIIDRADTFGLAQLYQLRGRVGRSKRQAFAYLMIPKQGNPGPDARARLKALQALDDLGVGFNLAVRDLEIRGAGNLLGKEQSGQVMSVGFDLYTKILKEAIANIKGEETDFRESIEPEIKLPVNAFIPEDYIPDVSERLLIYQRFSGIEELPEAEELLEELQDRYGRIPNELSELSKLMQLRSILRKQGIVKLEVSNQKLNLSFHPKANIDGAKVIALVKQKASALKLSRNDTLSWAIKESVQDNFLESIQKSLEELLPQIKKS